MQKNIIILFYIFNWDHEINFGILINQPKKIMH
jgi:hypothetical protein